MSGFYYHPGPFDSTTRQLPALAFIEKYSNKVDSLDLSGPSNNFYAARAKFCNADSVVYDGGEAIWAWMKVLFGQFSKVKHVYKTIRVLPATEDEWPAPSNANWVFLEAVTSFSMKGPGLSWDPIEVPRFLAFLVGKSEVEGQGTDGLQILQGNAWWDTNVLTRELAVRKGRAN